MKTWFLLAFYIFSCAHAFPQSTTRIYRMKNGSDITKTIPFKDRYQFEEFRDGKVFFKNGRVVSARLNYSLFHGEIQFVNPKRDTLLLTDNDFIDSISVGSNLFYYVPNRGHIEEIGNFEKIKLGRKQILVMVGHEKKVAYDQYSTTSAVSSYSSFGNKNGEFSWLKTADKILFRNNCTYFLIDKNQRFHLANKASLLRIFHNDQKMLSRYIKEENIEFLRQDDLIKVLEFCQSI